MAHVATWLESGGFAMSLLLFGFLPLVAIAGLLHLILSNRKSFLVLCLALGLTVGVGLLATGWNRSRVVDAMAAARPDLRLRLAVVGYGEANRPFQLSLAITLAGLLPTTLGEMRRSKRASRKPGV